MKKNFIKIITHKWIFLIFRQSLIFWAECTMQKFDINTLEIDKWGKSPSLDICFCADLAQIIRVSKNRLFTVSHTGLWGTRGYGGIFLNTGNTRHKWSIFHGFYMILYHCSGKNLSYGHHVTVRQQAREM